MKYLLTIFCLLFNSVGWSKDINSDDLIIKCIEMTGTEGQDIFKINKPEFFWYYNSKWYELAVSQKGVAKDWDINFKENLIRLYNKKMEWLREIDLNKMTAYMQFPSGEQYLYKCKKIKSIME